MLYLNKDNKKDECLQACTYKHTCLTKTSVEVPTFLTVLGISFYMLKNSIPFDSTHADCYK